MKYFGTDGIRGRVGEFPITADFVLRLGWAAGCELARRSSGRARVVIGKDTRISGYLFESALEAGLAAAGVDSLLLGPMPTPAVAHQTRSMGAVAGIVISASHNSYEDNGIKFFSGQGEKLEDSLQTAIEARLDEPVAHVAPEQLGRASRIDDAVGRYVEFCKGTVPWGTRLDGLKMVVDCANGATYRIAPEVFRELGAEVVAIFDRPDGLNINAGCGSTRPEAVCREVVERGADLGVAFDGDGDRVVMVDDRGELVDGDRILFILAEARRTAGTLSGGVVGTVMSNFGLEEALRERGIEFARSPVGDRYVHEWLRERDWVLGGEASGHILCLDRASTGCGIVSALQALQAVVESGRSVADLAAGMTRYPQVMINVPVNARPPASLEGHAELRQAVERAESSLDGHGRVILRPSGTEPVIRVTVEGPEEGRIRSLAEELAEQVTKVMA